MSITCISSKTICHSSSIQKWRFLIHRKEGPRPRVLPWQYHGRYHFASFLTFVTGAKFEWHHSNISRDIINFLPEPLMTSFPGMKFCNFEIIVRGKLFCNKRIAVF